MVKRVKILRRTFLTAFIIVLYSFNKLPANNIWATKTELLHEKYSLLESKSSRNSFLESNLSGIALLKLNYSISSLPKSNLSLPKEKTTNDSPMREKIDEQSITSRKNYLKIQESKSNISVARIKTSDNSSLVVQSVEEASRNESIYKVSCGNRSSECSISEKFLKRRTRLYETCEKNLGFHEPMETSYNSRLFTMAYSKMYNLMVCAVPKAGLSTMREHLRNMMPRHYKTSTIFPKSQMNITAAEQVQTKSSNVLVVRHPLDRLISGYRNKILRNENRMREDINQLYRRKKGTKVDLNLFLQYVLYVFPKQRRDMDGHWSSYDKSCSVCSIPYQYIFKTETLKEDLEYLKNSLKIQEININVVKNPTRNYKYRMQSMKYVQEYANADPCTLKKILIIFAKKLALFDYYVPMDIMQISEKM